MCSAADALVHAEVEAFYFVGSDDPRLNPHGAGTHLNVMAYMYSVRHTRGTARMGRQASPVKWHGLCSSSCIIWHSKL